MTSKNDGVGQPTKYENQYNSIALNLCKLGATDKELAKSFSVTETTINNWKVANESFFESIKEGKDYFDTGLIENALKKKALGYDYDEIKEESEGGEVKKKTVTKKHYAPDTGAIALFLKNRNPNRWKDKIEHTHIAKKSLADVLKDAANEE